MKKCFLGILALTLIFSMAVVGCGDSDDNGGNNGNGNGGNGNNGNGNGGTSIIVFRDLFDDDGSAYSGNNMDVTGYFYSNKVTTSSVLTIGKIENGKLLIEFPKVLDSYLRDVTGDTVTNGLKYASFVIGDWSSDTITLKIFPEPIGKNEVYFEYSNKDGTASYEKGGVTETETYHQGWSFHLGTNEIFKSLDELYELGYKWCYRKNILP